MRTLKSFAALLCLALPVTAAAWDQSAGAATVSYPDGYRSWTHVKSSLISPSHANFASSGGFQHIYANAEAMQARPKTRVPVEPRDVPTPDSSASEVP